MPKKYANAGLHVNVNIKRTLEEDHANGMGGLNDDDADGTRPAGFPQRHGVNPQPTYPKVLQRDYSQKNEVRVC